MLNPATTNSTINFHFNNEKIPKLEGVITSLRSIQDILGLSVDLHKELISEINTLESQSKWPKPKNIIIQESLKTVRSLLENVAGNALTPAIIGLITQLMS